VRLRGVAHRGVAHRGVAFRGKSLATTKHEQPQNLFNDGFGDNSKKQKKCKKSKRRDSHEIQ